MVVFVDLFAEIIEVFLLELDAGGSRVTASGDDRVFGKV